ncbi:WXG100 family type VII secretion target [Janibacter massiliensis]|uniref:WXG100 family type VII secretion target n=1 Tax=Janibacter massiliensis TaxID=2058291 RepID=UPI000D0E6658|nr:hypothetical protein [Janibacter massiliensis]
MGGFIGMNIEVVRGLFQKWMELVQKLADIITEGTAQTQEANDAWNGKDSEQWLDEWTNTHLPALKQIQEAMQALGDALNANIDQQQQTSDSL